MRIQITYQSWLYNQSEEYEITNSARTKIDLSILCLFILSDFKLENTMSFSR